MLSPVVALANESYLSFFSKGEHMNKLESDILNRLLHEPFTNKRALAEVSGDSLEIVNHELENLMNEGYIDKSIHLGCVKSFV